jgi:hypothetical protein
MNQIRYVLFLNNKVSGVELPLFQRITIMGLSQTLNKKLQFRRGPTCDRRICASRWSALDQPSFLFLLDLLGH